MKARLTLVILVVIAVYSCKKDDTGNTGPTSITGGWCKEDKIIRRSSALYLVDSFVWEGNTAYRYIMDADYPKKVYETEVTVYNEYKKPLSVSLYYRDLSGTLVQQVYYSYYGCDPYCMLKGVITYNYDPSSVSIVKDTFVWQGDSAWCYREGNTYPVSMTLYNTYGKETLEIYYKESDGTEDHRNTYSYIDCETWCKQVSQHVPYNSWTATWDGREQKVVTESGYWWVSTYNEYGSLIKTHHYSNKGEHWGTTSYSYIACQK